jgi:hypothetical protein
MAATGITLVLKRQDSDPRLVSDKQDLVALFDALFLENDEAGWERLGRFSLDSI